MDFECILDAFGMILQWFLIRVLNQFGYSKLESCEENNKNKCASEIQIHVRYIQSTKLNRIHQISGIKRMDVDDLWQTQSVSQRCLGLPLADLHVDNTRFAVGWRAAAGLHCQTSKVLVSSGRPKVTLARLAVCCHSRSERRW